jgi:precorrin-2/cobalt-factor-2 C20-methyltransferase
MTGTLHLVGVGPGDPELLTLKAVRVLGAASVVAYPVTAQSAHPPPQSGGGGPAKLVEGAATSESAFALSIAAPHINPAAEKLPVAIPMQLERGPAQAAYDAAATTILAHLREGRDVAWLCEGDPLFYGSAMYLCARVAGQAPVSVVPGITSLTAAAAAIARPLAARNEILKVLPAPLPDEVLRPELEATPAAAIIKVGRHFDRIRALLDASGHGRNAVVVEHATGARERITPLARFAFDERPYFSTILCYRGEEAWGTRGQGV